MTAALGLLQYEHFAGLVVLMILPLEIPRRRNLIPISDTSELLSVLLSVDDANKSSKASCCDKRFFRVRVAIFCKWQQSP